jgi:hypothetical protein
MNSRGNIFLANKYRKWYLEMIQNPDDSGYTEKHHIIPKSMGGSNKSSNLVKLSARQHFVAHWLLTKITYGSDRYKMLNAFNIMGARMNFKKKDTYINSKAYERNKIKLTELRSGMIRINNGETGKFILQEDLESYIKAGWKKGMRAETKRKMSEYKKKNMTNEDRNRLGKIMKGRIITESHRENLRKGAKNRPPMKNSTKEKLRIANTGKKKSQEARQKLSEALRGRKRKEKTKSKISQTMKGMKSNTLGKKWITKNGENKVLPPCEANFLVENKNWLYGRSFNP